MHALTVYPIQLSETPEKLQMMSQHIALKLNGDCQCMISAAYITAAQLSCDPQETTSVIYRARLSSTPAVSNRALINLLQDWVDSGSASVTLEFIALNLDATCSVAISSLNDPICPAPSTVTEQHTSPTGDTGQSSQTITIIVTVTLAVILAVVVSICGFYLYSSKFWRSRKFKPRSV